MELEQNDTKTHLAVMEKDIRNEEAEKTVPTIQNESEELELLKSQLHERDIEIEELKYEANGKDRDIHVLWEKIKEYEALHDSCKKSHASFEEGIVSNTEEDSKLNDVLTRRMKQLEERVEELVKHAKSKDDEPKCQKEVLEEVSDIENQILVAKTVKDMYSPPTLQNIEKNGEHSQLQEVNDYDDPIVIPGLEEMISDGSKSLVKFLLLKLDKSSAAYKELTCIMDESKIPAAAAKFGCINLIALLLTNGLSVNFSFPLDPNSYKNSCRLLHIAAKHNHKDLCNLLLLCGANGIYHPEVKRELTIDAYEYIDIFKTVNKDVDTQLSRKFKKTIFYCAIKNIDVETVKLFLVEDANILTSDGLTPLKIAVKSKNIEMVKLLMKNGAHLNKRPEDLRTLLYTTIRTNNIYLVDLMLSNSAILEAEESGGGTSIHHAARLGFADVIQKLLQKGVDVNKKDSFHKTAVDYARLYSHTGVVQFLQQYISRKSTPS